MMWNSECAIVCVEHIRLLHWRSWQDGYRRKGNNKKEPTEATVRLGTEVFQQPFIVVMDLPMEALLGADFIKSNHCILLLRSACLRTGR